MGACAVAREQADEATVTVGFCSRRGGVRRAAEALEVARGALGPVNTN
jgi:hypothetical protein